MTKQILKNKYGQIGYAQLESIISEIMQRESYPSWTFLNGVLSCDKFLGDNQLWFWWGDLRIVKPGQTRAGEMEILDDWNTEEDGTITLIGKKGVRA